jgi:DNA-binding XRE family transcriptional regulator
MSAKKNFTDKFLTGEEFEIWLKSRQITSMDAAEWLGVTKQTITHYKKAGVSKSQALAIAAIERGIKPWEPTDEDRKRAEGIPIE